jgi:hypothetical protein
VGPGSRPVLVGRLKAGGLRAGSTSVVGVQLVSLAVLSCKSCCVESRDWLMAWLDGATGGKRVVSLLTAERTRPPALHLTPRQVQAEQGRASFRGQRCLPVCAHPRWCFPGLQSISCLTVVLVFWKVGGGGHECSAQAWLQEETGGDAQGARPGQEGLSAPPTQGFTHNNVHANVPRPLQIGLYLVPKEYCCKIGDHVKICRGHHCNRRC